jgi:hypothetical protein
MMLTRISPNAAGETSMLFRVRPGWDSLRDVLEGKTEGTWYACTSLHMLLVNGFAAPVSAMSGNNLAAAFEDHCCSLWAGVEWQHLMRCLPGLRGRRQRFQVNVCTTAERQYALEAWRFLDPDARLIPHELRRKCLYNVPNPKERKKDIADAMGLGGRLWSSDKEPRGSAMPLAIIIDDRTDVRPDSHPSAIGALHL